MGLLEKIGSMFGEDDEKLLVLGLDCATPQLMFKGFGKRLPNLKRLIEGGTYGELRSSTPPITNPAWFCMLSSKSPGTLGAYGFRHRKTGTYDQYLATKDRIDHDRVWKYLNDDGKKTGVLGVPNTFPPEEVEGLMVTSFLTPDTDSEFVFPEEMKQEIIELASFDGKYSKEEDGYMLDIENFRSEDKKRILNDLFEMTEKRTEVTKKLLDRDDWDFFMTVFMAPDRLHHGFWKYFDEDHKDYEPGNEFEDAVPNYYEFLDHQIGEILEKVEGDTKIIVVSDHGAKKLDGCICLNEFLREEGYLTLNEEPEEQQRLDEDMIDWENTEAWGWGGYYARLFLNVDGREPEGKVPEEEYEEKREELIEKLENLKGPDGEDIGTKVLKPEEVYDTVHGDAPDLMVFFGDLNWRSSGSVGTGTLYLEENDTGPDHANHDWNGIFIGYDPDTPGKGKVEGLNIKDVAPTILKKMGTEIPEDFEGKPVDF